MAWGGLRQPVLPTLFEAARTARLHQLRAALAVMRGQVDRLQSGLDAWDRQIAAATGDTTTQTDPYDTTDTGAAPPPPAPSTAQPVAADTTTQPVPVSTTTTTSTTTSGGTASVTRTQPSSRILYAIFDDLPSHALTESGYPKMSVVNEALEDEGIGPADTTWVHQKYDSWSHARDRDRAEASEDEEDEQSSSPGKRPTEAVLQSIFATLDLDDSRDMTDAGTPRVKVVNEALSDRGYRRADADKIADAFADWSGGSSSTLKKPTDAALFAVFETLDLDDQRDVTTHGVPRHDVVADALQKKGYAAADADQIAEAFGDWKARSH